MDMDETEVICNDVPAYLKELVPYRCPKCGHRRSFATLRELRQHLQRDHDFQVGFVIPHTRVNIFDKEAHNLSKPESHNLLKSSHTHNPTLKRESINKKNNYNTAITKHEVRESSLLLQSFKDEAELLEIELQHAKQTEMKNKTRSMKSMYNENINTDFETIQHEQEADRTPNILEESVELGIPKSIDIKHTLDTLNNEIMKSRLKQWVTNDALYKSHDILQGMEQAAEDKCKEQQTIIQTLLQDIKIKDEHVEETNRQHLRLSQERQRLFDKTEMLVTESDTYNKLLQEKLYTRGYALECLNSELDRLKSLADRELKSKETDLQNSRDAITRLEWERVRLVEETDCILKQADKDNDDLRHTINTKEQELQRVNQELNQVRWNQQAILEKTMDVCMKSEESKDILKTVLKVKEGQLYEATEQTERMTTLQKRLVEELRILTEQADENTVSMKKLLQLKEDQVKEALHHLEVMRREKLYLEENTSSLAEMAESSLSVIDHLKKMVKKKERDLNTTQSELLNLKSFIQSTAAKEKTARSKLELFIEDLIKRAEMAESELRALRSVPRDSLKMEVRRPHNDTMPATINEPVIDLVNGLAGVSERQILPARISPKKPPRKKYSNTLNKAENSKMLREDFIHGFRQNNDVTNTYLDTNMLTTQAEIHHQNKTIDKQNRHGNKASSYGGIKATNNRHVDEPNLSYHYAGVNTGQISEEHVSSNKKYAKEEPECEERTKRGLNRFPPQLRRKTTKSPTETSLCDDGVEERQRERWQGHDTRSNADDNDNYTDLDEETDEFGDGFSEIMDEDGILWEVNADTLPDVSDSEFDRVSPSGSGAIAPKKTGRDVKSNTASKFIENDQSKTHLMDFCHDNKGDNEQTIVTGKGFEKLDKSKKLDNTIRHFKASGISSESNVNNGDGKHGGGVFKAKQRKTTTDLPKRFPKSSEYLYKPITFKPISDSTENKNSLSDMEMTSGGKEVHTFMSKSPRIDIHGLSASFIESLRFGKSNHSRGKTDMSSKNDKQEDKTLDDKLKQISNKYTQKRTVNSIEAKSKTKNVMDDKIKSINEKYTRRRQDIVTGKGVESSNSHEDIKGLNNCTSSKEKLKVESCPFQTDNRNYKSNSYRTYRNSGAHSANQQGVSNVLHENENAIAVLNGFPSESVSAPTYGNMHDPYYPSYLNPMLSRFLQPKDWRYPQPNQGNGPRPTFPYNSPYLYTHLPLYDPSFVETTESVYCENNNNVAAGNAVDSLNKNIKSDILNPYVELRSTNDDQRSKGDFEHVSTTSFDKLPQENPQTDVKGYKANIESDHTCSTHTPAQSPQTPNQMPKLPNLIVKESDIEMENILHDEIKQTLDIQSEGDHQNTNNSPAGDLCSNKASLELEEGFNIDSKRRSQSSPSRTKNPPDTIGTLTFSALISTAPTINSTELTPPLFHKEPLVTSSPSESLSLFAETIEGPLVGYNSQYMTDSQYITDLQGNAMDNVDSNIDTDTESVRPERIKEMRNEMSSASSQASIDFLDAIPTSRREEVKRRRQALSYIFSFLDTATLCRIAEVCKEWRIVSRSNKLWQRIEMRNEKVSSKFLMHIARRCSQLRVLILEDLRPRNRKKSESIEQYQRNTRSSLEAGYEQILKKSEASLHTISIINCGSLFSSKCLWAASCYSRMLKHVTYLSDFDPINAEVMWALGSGCRDLKTLRVHPINPSQRPDNFSTRCAQLIGKCFPDLETMSIGGTEVDITALIFIAKQCQKLVEIELNHMSLVTTHVIENMCQQGLSHLQSIRFVGTPVSQDGISLLHENCHHLERIYIQLSVYDYFKGIKQKENLKLYEEEVHKYKELKKTTTTLGHILNLNLNQTLNMSSVD